MTEALEPLPATATAWATIREALRGSHQDFTEGPIGRAVVLLAIPMVLEMVMESVFAVTDMFFVSRLGADSVAAVGLTESVLSLVYAIAMGLSMGVTALVARRIGEKDHLAASRSAAQGILLGGSMALVLGVAGVIFAPNLLRIMGASPAVIAAGSGYTRVILGGDATVVLLFVLNAAFRGAGDPSIAMRVLWIANGINIILGPCLIFGVGPFPRLGVTGAAVATTIGRGTGAILAFSAMVRPGGRLLVRLKQFVPDRHLLRQLVALGSSASLQFLVGTASWIGLTRLLATFGSEAVAGYTVALRMVIFAILPAWGLANAAATMVGQGLGAGKPDRAEAAVWTACRYNFAFLTILGVIFLIAAPALAGLFGHDPVMSGYAVRCLRIISLGFPLYAFGMVLTQAFNGAGDTWTPTWLNFLIFWCWEIPLAWLLAKPLGIGSDGAFIAIAVAFSTLAGASTIIFRRGTWKAAVV
jgi:putative MATE family efflux protein